MTINLQVAQSSLLLRRTYRFRQTFDFGLLNVWVLQIKWDFPATLTGIRGGRQKRRCANAASFILACQPPPDLAINLHYTLSDLRVSDPQVNHYVPSPELPAECQVVPVCEMTSVSAAFYTPSSSGMCLVSKPFALSRLSSHSSSLLSLFCDVDSSSISPHTRGHKDGPAQYGQRSEGAVPGFNPGQGHGGPAGGAGRHHHRQHHPQRCQR